MKPMRSRTPFRKAVKTNSRESKESVKVFSRIKPLQNDNDSSCLRVITPTSVKLVHPEAIKKGGTYKEITYTFQHVFMNETDAQKKVFDTVALPLVDNLIQGKNGLLFTYGVTGSGKTYTMNGDNHDGGIMPRCLDVVFNSILDYQARKYIFKPDKMNGFEVQTEAEAHLDRANSLTNLCTPRTPFRRKRDVSPKISRTPDQTRVTKVDEDSTYAVFVTYIEIYNNYIYDLLENVQDERTRLFQNKTVLRSDSRNNIYVHGVVEVEVKSAQEAIETLQRGQKRKRMAITNLNSESSRSHSVFTIRLVQAPLDREGESAVCNKDAVTISQLSLVDLAGSERTNKTQNTGQRLREAGNINNSLMTLRTCLEILRENQLQGANKMIPYRDSKITNLFKNFFEGEGIVHVVVCVNPLADDYDETLQVMKFAEMAQEVQVTKPPVTERPALDLIPGRRRANQIFKEVVQAYEEKHKQDSPMDIDPVFNLGPPLPEFETSGEDEAQMLAKLLAHGQARMKRRSELSSILKEKSEHFREKLMEMERNFTLIKEENFSLKASLEHERSKRYTYESIISDLQNRLTETESVLNQRDNYAEGLKHEVLEKDMLLKQQVLDRKKLQQKLSAENEKKNEYRQKLISQQELKLHNQAQDERLRMVRAVLDSPSSAVGANPLTKRSFEHPKEHTKECATQKGRPVTDIHLASAGVLNASASVKPETRYRTHRRSQSAGDLWLDHRAAMPADLGTVLQPVMKRRRSVTKLVNVADVTDPKVSKYCLTTQEHDPAGDLETRLYKGDVVPTTSGGAQVIFNEMESLRQLSPEAISPRKRTAAEIAKRRDVPEICSVAIEGHGKKPRV